MQSALFNFQSLLLVILLLICTCTYIRAVAPRLIDSNKQGCVSSFLVVRTSSPPSFPFHDPISFRMHVLSTLRILIYYDTASWVYSSCPHESVRLRLHSKVISILNSFPHPPLPSAGWVRSVCIQERGYRHTSRWRALQWLCG